MMKKIISLLLLVALLVGVTLPHVHDDQCGYNPETKSGCVYEEVEPLRDGDFYN